MKNSYVKRYLLLFVGLTIMAFGIAFSVKAKLGTSPVSSLPYTLSLISPMSVGVGTMVMHVAFILLQILILRRDYDPVQLLQLPVALAFGFMTDAALWTLGGITYSSYLTQWLFCAIGIVLVAVGVSIEVTANVATLAGEGLILAICKRFRLKFGNMKICFDVSLVLLSVIIGFVFRHTLVGVREGTVAAAVMVGMLAKVFCIPLKKFADNNG